MTTREQESGAGVADRQLDEENMKEILPFCKPNSMEGPTGIQLQYNQRTKGETPKRDKVGHTIESRGIRPQRGITGGVSSPVGSGNQTRAPPDTMKTLSSQCLSMDCASSLICIPPGTESSLPAELGPWRALWGAPGQGSCLCPLSFSTW